MPYIGNTAADRFVASKAASVFSGDGSTTAFTLDHSVGSDEDILVSVDGVIQEPSVAYSVSGTTLTFTAAPSSNAGNNIFVYYLFRTVGTVSHPSSNALEATSGTFSSDVTVSGAFTSQGIDDNADATAITIDSSENVGIGASSPNTKLHLTGNLTIENTSNAPFIDFVESGDNTDSKARIGMDQVSGTAGQLIFSTEGSGTLSERMRVTSDGDVVVGRTSYGFNNGDGVGIDPVGQIALEADGGVLLRLNRKNNDGHGLQFYRGATNIVGSITFNVSTVTYNTSSDYRLKENVSYDFDATTRLKQLKPCRFNFIIDADTTVDGFLAHEVQSVVPEAITGEKDAVDADGNIEPQGIDHSKLVPLLVKTIQELEARITALENS